MLMTESHGLMQLSFHVECVSHSMAHTTVSMLKKKSEILGRAFSNGKTFSKLAKKKHEVFSDVRLLLLPYKNA